MIIEGSRWRGGPGCLAMDLTTAKSLADHDEDYGDFRSHSRGEKRERNIRKKTHPRSTSAINTTSTTLHIPRTQATIQLHNLHLPQPTYTYPNEFERRQGFLAAKKNYKTTKKTTFTTTTTSTHSHEKVDRSQKRAARRKPQSTMVDVEATKEEEEEGGARGSDGEEKEEEEEEVYLISPTMAGSNHTTYATSTHRSQGTHHSPHHSSSFRQQQLLLQRGEDRRVVTVKTAEALGAVNVSSCLPSGLSSRPRSSSSKKTQTPTSTSTSNQDCYQTSSATDAVVGALICETCGGSQRQTNHALNDPSASSSSSLRNDGGVAERGCSCGNRRLIGASNGGAAASPADVRRWTQYAVEEGIYERGDDIDARMRELARLELSSPRSIAVKLEEMDRRNRQRRQDEALGRVVEGAVERFEGGFSDGHRGRRKKGWGARDEEFKPSLLLNLN